MKTSNKLLLGLLILILVIISIGLVYLKTELKNAGIGNHQNQSEFIELKRA